jgi:hypothetical protein
MRMQALQTAMAVRQEYLKELSKEMAEMATPSTLMPDKPTGCCDCRCVLLCMLLLCVMVVLVAGRAVSSTLMPDKPTGCCDCRCVCCCCVRCSSVS